MQGAVFDSSRICDEMEKRTSVTSSLWLSTYCRIGEFVDLESLRQSSALEMAKMDFCDMPTRPRRQLENFPILSLRLHCCFEHREKCMVFCSLPRRLNPTFPNYWKLVLRKGTIIPKHPSRLPRPRIPAPDHCISTGCQETRWASVQRL